MIKKAFDLQEIFVGARPAYCFSTLAMENIYQSKTPALEASALNHWQSDGNPSRRTGIEVAHELNHIFTIICGFTGRMLVKHGGNATLRPDLQLISKNARRAELLVKQAVKAGSPSPAAA